MNASLLKMIGKKTGLVLITSLICVSSLFAGGRQDTEDDTMAATDAEQAVAVSIIDDLGREVTLNAPVRRIAYSHYGTAEALKILDVWDLVKARDGFTGNKVIFPDLDEIPALGPPMGSPYEPNLEMLLSMDIDLFIAEIVPLPGLEDLIAMLEPEITVVALTIHDPEKICDGIEKLGTLLGREREAGEYVDWYTEVASSLEAGCESLSESEKSRVFFKTGYSSPEDLMTILREESYASARNNCTGSVNIAANVPSEGRYVTSVDPEWLASQALDVVVVLDPLQAYGAFVDNYTPLIEHRRKVMEIPALSGSNAVKNDRVYMLSSEFASSPCFIVGFAYMAKWFHPERFKDLSPTDLLQQYYSRFMRVDVDLSEQGIFAYPAEEEDIK